MYLAMKHKLPIEHHITLEYLLRQVSILTLQTLLNSAKLFSLLISIITFFAISSEKDFTHTQIAKLVNLFLQNAINAIMRIEVQCSELVMIHQRYTK